MKVPKNRFRQDNPEEWIDWDVEGKEGEENDEYARRLLRREKHLRKRKNIPNSKQFAEGMGEGERE